MYNPARQQPHKKKRRPQPSPHAGTKHSDIMKRRGVGLTAPAYSSQKRMPFGYISDVFSCDDFEVKHVIIYQGNSLGYGFHPSKDRTIRVLRGDCFVHYEGKSGHVETQRLQTDEHMHAKRNANYGIATSGTTPVELLFIQSVNYEEDWETLQPAEFANKVPELSTPPTASIPSRRPKSESKALQQAAKKPRRAPAQRVPAQQQSNVNSGTFFGVNPRPMGPRAAAEE